MGLACVWDGEMPVRGSYFLASSRLRHRHAMPEPLLTPTRSLSSHRLWTTLTRSKRLESGITPRSMRSFWVKRRSSEPWLRASS